MTKVTGIGGISLKAKDPKALSAWYDEHLGLSLGEYSYMSFKWNNPHHPTEPGQTVFAFHKSDSKYFSPSEKDFMINFRVNNLEELLKELKAKGVWVDEKVESADYGKFGWIMDPEGNKIELWEPVDD